MQHPQQVQFFPDSSLPLGQGDLEALERLKEVIKSNQHEIFRATPRLAALASLYRGPLPSSISPHPEQILSNPKEEPTTTPSSPSFEAPSSSTFISGAHSAHAVSAVQGAMRPSISSDIVRALLRLRHCYPLTYDCNVASFQYGESAGSESYLD
jgi:hypothetical protein